jgi:RNA polymerase sigma-70 factor (ECF subfamily)
VDEALAEDVVQETFLVVWRDPGRFDPARGSVSSWLLTLVHHRAVDAVRREATRRRRTVAPRADGGEWLPPGPGADQAALGAVVAGKVRDALAELPAEQREALALAYFGGYTQREVSSLVGVPLGTVKSRMFAGVQKLRTLLGPHVEVEGEGR